MGENAVTHHVITKRFPATRQNLCGLYLYTDNIDQFDGDPDISHHFVGIFANHFRKLEMYKQSFLLHSRDQPLYLS